MKRLNAVKEALLIKNKKMDTDLHLKHFEYNYLLPLFQVCVINLLQCWDKQRVWIWELSSNFLQLSLQILSFLHEFLSQQVNENCDACMLITVHSDWHHFVNWIRHELMTLIEHRCVDCISVEET